jgi:hypothetical protein
MNLKRCVWTVATMVVAFSVALGAQQPPRQFFLLYEDHVKPSMGGAYEASIKDMNKALAEAKASSPMFEMMAFTYEDFATYCYLTPIPNYAALDGMEPEWMKISEKVGKERWKKIMEANAPTTEGFTQMVVEYLPALSYIPAAPRLKASEMPYFVDYYYYVMPGKESEFKDLAKQYAALYKSKGISNGWNLYQIVVGDSLPLFVVGHDAKDALDFAEWDKKDTVAMGNEAQALFAKVLAVCRKVEARPGSWRPDLSFHVPPPDAPAKK